MKFFRHKAICSVNAEDRVKYKYISQSLSVVRLLVRNKTQGNNQGRLKR